METLSTKFFSALLLMIFGGGWTLPLGLPPAAENPAVAGVAPEKCLFYVSWAGMAAANPASKNQTEQLLAEPEVQRSFATLATIVSNTVLPDLANSANFGAGPAPVPPQPATTNAKVQDSAEIRQIAIDFAKIVATRPGAVFVTKINTTKDGTLQDARGGMFVAADHDSEELRAVFERFRKQVKAAGPPSSVTNGSKPPHEAKQVVREVQIAGLTWYRLAVPSGCPPVTCGFQGSDFILGVGDGSVEEILKHRQEESPAWLVNLRKQLPVERVSTVVYLNIKMLLAQITADEMMPKTREALRRLGLDKLSALSSVSGFEGETFTSRMLLSTDGEPQGILNLFSDQPLRAGDLMPIPRDATLALAMRFDARKAADQFAAVIEKPEPAERSAIDALLDAIAKPLSVDLRRDVPKALGDTCCVYSSPSEGGLVLLGLTAVVPIRDREALSVIQAKFVASWLATTFQDEFNKDPLMPSMFQSTARLHACSFAGRRIYYITDPVGIAPAWCATDRELIVAMVPQSIMAYLQHNSEHKSLATVPQVGRLIQSPDAPGMLVYVDTAKLFELVYPLVPLLAQAYLGNLHREYLDGEIPPLDSIPSAPTVSRHLVPGTAALRRTKQGLELTSRQPLPGSGLLWTAMAVMQSPQTLEQQVAAEDLPQNAGPVSPFPAPVPFAGPDNQTETGPAAPTVGPARTFAPSDATPGTAPTTGTYGSAPNYVPAPVPGNSPPLAPSAVAASEIPLPAGSSPGHAPAVAYAPAGLAEIGGGIKAYRIKNRKMPPAYLADKQGKPLLSWRVAILPYVGQQGLYERFHLDEPWDSPHNRQLLPLVPEVYREPDATLVSHAAAARPTLENNVAGKTRFLLLRGPKTLYAEPTPPMPTTYEDWVKVIVVVVQKERAVPWTKPEEFTYDPKDPGAGIARSSDADCMLGAGSEMISIPVLYPVDKSAAKEMDRFLLLPFFTGEEPNDAAPHRLPSSPYPYSPVPVPSQ